MLKHYPWGRLEKGQAFFVPALDVEAEKTAGLRAAVAQRVLDARARVGIKDGRIGLLFYRQPRARS